MEFFLLFLKCYFCAIQLSVVNERMTYKCDILREKRTVARRIPVVP